LLYAHGVQIFADLRWTLKKIDEDKSTVKYIMNVCVCVCVCVCVWRARACLHIYDIFIARDGL